MYILLLFFISCNNPVTDDPINKRIEITCPTPTDREVKKNYSARSYRSMVFGDWELSPPPDCTSTFRDCSDPFNSGCICPQNWISPFCIEFFNREGHQVVPERMVWRTDELFGDKDSFTKNSLAGNPKSVACYHDMEFRGRMSFRAQYKGIIIGGEAVVFGNPLCGGGNGSHPIPVYFKAVFK